MHVQNQAPVTERNAAMRQDAGILLKLAELLLEDQLISPKEKIRLAQLIRKEQAI